MIKKLRYGNTNSFYIGGDPGGLLIDTDYAGTLPAFFKALKAASLEIKDISHVMATHYHPDHVGLIGELQQLGVKLLLIDLQKDHVHFADPIFAKEVRLRHKPADEALAEVISCGESRSFLGKLGIAGEIIHTPSHSPDSVSLILDCGEVFAGDLEPIEYLYAYDKNPALEKDWEKILSYNFSHIYYAHANDVGI